MTSRRRSKYTKELLEPIVTTSCSMSGVMRTLGIKPSGGNFRMIRALLSANGLSTAHFTGQGWAGGQTRESNSSIDEGATKNALPDDEVFKLNGRPITGAKLRNRLLRLGWTYACTECGLTKWLERSITLHVDYINGIHSDNRLENLRFLCPNCHQQTTTWGATKQSTSL
jgi:5-methylcytosine-specific restriction endonuclease McrA